ncbi:hypothetical protein QJS10_CPB14g01090 [Acorus calamus]|uniref:NAD(+) diphosphatase n=1 Tax=Acorus calamus TaxID=4465 RepID=A0AAV9DBB7_ACOCL|nr:hypothetical protein QJS10_CPB14g01090 [Acorus calamus]
MSITLQTHAFAGNPLRSNSDHVRDSPTSASETLKALLLEGAHDGSSSNFRVLPFRKGRPLASSSDSVWRLGWLRWSELGALGLPRFDEGSFVYLGPEAEEAGGVCWAIDVSDSVGGSVVEVGSGRFCFVELRTLMVATDWTDETSMGELAIAGHVVIMLVIDKANDRALLSRPSRFVPRMWSCLSGFIEPGESLEEAVRRETWEETGIEVDEVIYHSSQPWPVGPNSMPCQLMVGFFAYAKSFEITVDKEELEDAQWHSREDVKKALTFAEYEKAQRTVAVKVEQMCKGVEKGQNFSSDFNVESGELAQMFIPGPFAIAHHLISSWVHQGLPQSTGSLLKSDSQSNL